MNTKNLHKFNNSTMWSVNLKGPTLKISSKIHTIYTFLENENKNLGLATIPMGTKELTL